MKIRTVETKLFHAEGQTDRHKELSHFSNFANESKKCHSREYYVPGKSYSSVGQHSYRRQPRNNIKIDIMNIQREDVDCTHQRHDREKWRAVQNTAMTPRYLITQLNPSRPTDSTSQSGPYQIRNTVTLQLL